MKYSRCWITPVLTVVLLLTPALTVMGSSGALSIPSSLKTPEAIVRVWVAYESGHGPEVRQALSQSRATFHYDFADLETYVVTLPAAALNGIRRHPRVSLVEEDALRLPIAARPSTVTRDAAAVQNVLDAVGQTVPYGIDMVQARDIWDVNRDGVVDAGAPTGAGRTLCLIDSGYYQEHEDLPNAVGGHAQIDGPWTTDGRGHGTHVAATMAALNNGLGVVGVSPGTVGLYVIKYFDNDGLATFASSLVDALLRCRAAGANVVNLSLGGPVANTLERLAFDDAYAAGVLSVAAAGNEGSNRLTYPAAYNSVISVAAINSHKVVAGFSQYNGQVELAAPGVGVLSAVSYLESTTLNTAGGAYTAQHVEYSARGTVSGVLAHGGPCSTAGTWQGKVVLCERGGVSFYDKVMNVQLGGGVAAVVYNNAPGGFTGTLGEGSSSPIIGISLSQEDGRNLVASALGQTATVTSLFTIPASGYVAWDGTSMAAPHVSAVAALVWSANPSWSNVQIREALQATALDLGSAGRDSSYGYGLVQAKAALEYLLPSVPSNTPPAVIITSPASGATYPQNTPITLSATASDTQEGDLSAGIVWTAGGASAGTGASITLASLSTGVHTITASATDSGNLSGSASVTLEITSAAAYALQAAVDAGAAVYGDKAKVPVLVTVRDQDGALVSGAAVEVTVTSPTGLATRLKSSTSSDGTAGFIYRINASKTGTGQYTVSAAATSSGHLGATAVTHFRVP